VCSTIIPSDYAAVFPVSVQYHSLPMWQCCIQLTLLCLQQHALNSILRSRCINVSCICSTSFPIHNGLLSAQLYSHIEWFDLRSLCCLSFMSHLGWERHKATVFFKLQQFPIMGSYCLLLYLQRKPSLLWSWEINSWNSNWNQNWTRNRLYSPLTTLLTHNN